MSEKRCKTCGFRPCRCADLASRQPPLAGAPSIWGAENPLRSEALAVHPSQIPAVMERNKRHGLGHIKYDRQGRPLLTDRAMRRDLMRLEGGIDRNGGYGDTNATSSPQDPLSEDATGGPICDLQQLERDQPNDVR